MADVHAEHSKRHFAFVAICATFVFVLCALVFAYFLANRPVQEATQSRTVVVVRNPPALDAAWDMARAELWDLGYIEGKNIEYVITEVSSDLETTKSRIAPLLDGDPIDLVLTFGVLATRAAKEVTQTSELPVPVVFAVVSDPVGGGIVRSMQSSGNNLTGITPANEFAASKRLEFLKALLPGAKRIVYAWNDERTSGVEGLRRIAPGLGLELVDEQVADVASMVAFLDTFPYKRGDAILRASDSIGAGAAPRMIEIAIREKIPLIGTNSGDTERGALMSYGADYAPISARAARMIDQIFKGAAPSDISIEEASDFDLAVNTDTATKIAVTIPQSFLIKVRHVYPTE